MIDETRRYEALDGLRGVAAVGVLVYHVGTYTGTTALLPHGEVAVDFFFMLSGFVLAHAYSGRLPAMAFAEFVRARLIRMLPLSVLGLAFGTAWLAVRHAMLPANSVGLMGILRAGVLNLFLIPDFWSGPLSDHWSFPADGPLWSLSFELLVNLLWAGVLFRIGTPSLVRLCAGAAVALVVAVWWSRDLNLGGFPSTWAGGGVRTVFGFFLGVLLWRFRPRVRPSRTRVWLSVALLVGAMAVPDVHWTASVVIVVLVLPAVVWLAASASYRSERPAFRILGDLSYPLYALHIPSLAMFCGLLKASHAGNPASAWTYAVVPPLIAAALVLDRAYDRPVRRMVARRTAPARPDGIEARASGSA